MRPYLLLLALVACSDAADLEPGYTVTSAAVSYECAPAECGPYPELARCGDGSVPRDIRCGYVPTSGCRWVIVLC